MVKIISLADGEKTGRKVLTFDALDEISHAGIKGMYIYYNELNISNNKTNFIFKDKALSKKDLEENVGELIGVKRYRGTYSIHGGLLLDEGPTNIPSRQFFKLNQSGIIQTWDILDIF